MSIETVKQQYEEDLLRLRNVVGVAIGEPAGGKVIKVFVSRKVPEMDLDAQDIVPRAIGGYRTDVVEIGDITPA